MDLGRANLPASEVAVSQILLPVRFGTVVAGPEQQLHHGHFYAMAPTMHLFLIVNDRPLRCRNRHAETENVARQLGRTGGRKRRMTDSKIQSAKKLLANGVPPKDVAKNLGVSIPTLYRWVPASSS